MKNRIRLTESQLHNVIKGVIRRMLSESKSNNGWACTDLGQCEHFGTKSQHNSDIDGQIRKLRKQLEDCSPEEEKNIQNKIDALKKKNGYLKETHNKCVKMLSENDYDAYDDYASDFDNLNNVLSKNGWACDNSYEVESKDGETTGTRYEISPYPNNTEGIDPTDEETLKNEISNIFGDRAIFSVGHHRYAPEITKLSVIIIDMD